MNDSTKTLFERLNVYAYPIYHSDGHFEVWKDESKTKKLYQIMELDGDLFKLDDGEKMITLICDGSNWRPLFAPPSHGVDSGMIAIFVAACPTGWTRVSAWDGKYLRGAASYGGAGGAATHDHTVSDHIHSFAHTHNQKIGVWAPKIYADGDWENKMGYSSGGASGADIYGQVANDSNSYNRVASGFASGGGDSGLGGAGNTGAVNHEPPYIEVIFCKKD